MKNNNIVTVNEASFTQEVINSQKPVIVDFWAEWCGPCKMIAPVLEEIAQENVASVKVAKVDVDENQGLAKRYNIQAIPTLLIFVGGEAKEQVVGFMSKEAILEKVKKVTGTNDG